MSDAQIRELEREITISGDTHAILQLDKLLRRSGRDTEYYASRVVERFWTHYTLETFFAGPTEGFYFWLALPDCFGVTTDGIAIRVHLRPSMGVGWAPSVFLTGEFRTSPLIMAMFPNDPHAQKEISYSFQPLQPARSANLECIDLYDHWVNYGVVNPEFRYVVNTFLHSAFADVWAQLNETCEEIAQLSWVKGF